MVMGLPDTDSFLKPNISEICLFCIVTMCKILNLTIRTTFNMRYYKLYHFYNIS